MSTKKSARTSRRTRISKADLESVVRIVEERPEIVEDSIRRIEDPLTRANSVRRLIPMLSDILQESLVEAHDDGVSINQIAKRLEMTRQAVSQRLRSAATTLQHNIGGA